MTRTRADMLLTEKGLMPSRARAAAAIRESRVRADGEIIAKPGQMIDAAATITIENDHTYVSRGALKLTHALDAFSLHPAGRACLDLGASTGGFTQVLLERGARGVYAVDVGHGQLHPGIAGDARVISLEKLNARDLTPAHLPGPVEAITADLSFISLRKALPPALDLAAPGAWLVALIKPQFEVGRAHIGKGGIVRDAAVREAACRDVAAWLGARAGWRVLGLTESPVKGGDGNTEHLIAAQKAPHPSQGSRVEGSGETG